MQTWTRMGVLIVALAGIGGCSTTGIGKADFSCAGPPGGIGCIDSMNVYEITNDPELRDALVAELTAARERDEEVDPYEVLEKLKAKRTPTVSSVKSIVEPITQPKPILKPAKVVRIWVAPWVDRKGDLHMPGYVFSEITPRRWELGEPEKGTATILAPVQLDKPAVTSATSPSAQ